MHETTVFRCCNYPSNQSFVWETPFYFRRRKKAGFKRDLVHLTLPFGRLPRLLFSIIGIWWWFSYCIVALAPLPTSTTTISKSSISFCLHSRSGNSFFVSCWQKPSNIFSLSSPFPTFSSARSSCRHTVSNQNLQIYTAEINDDRYPGAGFNEEGEMENRGLARSRAS